MKIANDGSTLQLDGHGLATVRRPSRGGFALPPPPPGQGFEPTQADREHALRDLRSSVKAQHRARADGLVTVTLRK